MSLLYSKKLPPFLKPLFFAMNIGLIPALDGLKFGLQQFAQGNKLDEYHVVSERCQF